MNCVFAKQTGKPCRGGYSREIICEKGINACLRNCGKDCPDFMLRKTVVDPKDIATYRSGVVYSLGHGVGSELTKLFARFGIHETGGCGCSSLARRFDGMGVEACQTHRKQIVDSLLDNAKSRGWKFRPRFLVSWIVDYAIWKAKRNVDR